MPEDITSKPLKIGLLIATTAYFLFTLHAVLTTSWVGEWENLGPTMGFVIYVEDIAATAGMIFRFVASLVAFVAVAVYLARKPFSQRATNMILTVVLFGEAIYWLGLLPSGIMPIIYLRQTLFSLFTSEIPCMVESIAIPIALLMLVVNLRHTKPRKQAIRWTLIAGTAYVFVFWLVNTGIWVSTIWGYRGKGIAYLTDYPENLLNFGLTAFGLLALAASASWFTKKSWNTESLDTLNLRAAGTLITLLGLWFLWNYLTWIIFGQNALWSAWFAWFLGHNLDLWLLTLPLVGLPLMYSQKSRALGITNEGSNI